MDHGLTNPRTEAPNYLLKGVLLTPVALGGVRRRKATNIFSNLCFYNPRITWACNCNCNCNCNDGGTEVYVNPPHLSSPADFDMIMDSSGDGYIALFVQILGLDHDPLDREQTIIALWKYSLGGKQCVDMIMQFRGSLNLTINLLRSDSDAAFMLLDTESEIDMQNPELHALVVQEAGHAISAASRLLTRLLDFEQFCHNVNASHFTKLLRKVLKSDIPLHHKDWVAACLVKLSYLSGPKFDYDNTINLEVTLYETIPKLIEQIKTSYSSEVQEASVIELNRIISEEVVNSTRAVSAEGGIFPLMKLLENVSERAVEAVLAILYNLSMYSENHAAIIAAGAVPILRRLVLAQRSHWMRALRLLTLPT